MMVLNLATRNEQKVKSEEKFYRKLAAYSIRQRMNLVQQDPS